MEQTGSLKVKYVKLRRLRNKGGSQRGCDFLLFFAVRGAMQNGIHTHSLCFFEAQINSKRTWSVPFPVAP